MTTLSLLGLDHSDRLAKRFATLTSAYLDMPAEAQSDAAKIPIENLFRLLQMFRYDAFGDEPRSGVLQFGPLRDLGSRPLAENEWHKDISSALKTALDDVFHGKPRDEAVLEIQSALSWLVTNANKPTEDVRLRAKAFLSKFATSLV
ncbi:MAG TPA: hypothetical protein VGQ22_25015 [Steroidobacteraceae bacterium]|jgi:hypothetical protein|nr:hypothetical protein [Steroidobacteraceae bacterium]